MANRWFQQFRFSLEKAVVDLYLTVSFDGAGEPFIVSGKGIKSIVHIREGLYTITLGSNNNIDTYRSLLNVVGSVLVDARGTLVLYTIQDEQVNTTGTIDIQFYSIESTPNPIDPTSALGRFTISLSNSYAS